jgi:NAD-dependent dihydropyrimidine dehydrogenase PreA subunit
MLIDKLTGRKDMAYKIDDNCVNCGSCVSDCPADAISEKDGKHWIDPEKCQDCGACVATCPTESISAG